MIPVGIAEIRREPEYLHLLREKGDGIDLIFEGAKVYH